MSMRLTDKELKAIQSSFRKYFGENDRLWLFGSRADDTKRGGDIDLYVETRESNLDKIISAKHQFVIDLIKSIGDQKIDVVLNVIPNKKELSIYKFAKETGIQIV